ncbi:MAG TPA: S-methyl-5-thioribose-1-phosphate isomerase [Anaerolineaceae bacterium]|nr:S-methyl-5-thioribose-1-phosphate isomerase [Anaerolineaceae bacterium]
MRTLEWDAGQNRLRMIDQRLLPARFEVVSYDTAEEVAQAITEMVIRGAPAIGVAAAFGLALAGLRSNATQRKAFLADIEQAGVTLRAARPTAVNLAWAIDRVLGKLQANEGTPAELRQFLLDEAQSMADEDVATNRRMAEYGAALIQDGDTLIHHCNTGSLATVDWGTALGVIRMAHEKGKRVHVLVDETRPRLQGARLTAWELQQYGIPYDIISDNAAGFFLQRGQVQRVFFGADRVAANGDVANKVGSYMLALAAHDNDVPVFSVFPASTVDLTIRQGGDIPIEERGAEEVLGIQIAGERVTPNGASARNPAFDITPHRLFTGLVTDCGVIFPPFISNLRKAIQPNRSLETK